MFTANEKASYAAAAATKKTWASVAIQTDTTWLKQPEPVKYKPQLAKPNAIQTQTYNNITTTTSDKKSIYNPNIPTTPLSPKSPPSPSNGNKNKNKNRHSNKHKTSDRVSKADKDPVSVANRFQDLDLDVDMDDSPCPSRSTSHSPSRRRASSEDPGGRKLTRLLE